jgi:hypothetical protein
MVHHGLGGADGADRRVNHPQGLHALVDDAAAALDGVRSG